MHGAAVVPHHHVADLPLLMPVVLRQRAVVPELVEQGLAVGRRQAHDVAAEAPAEIERLAQGARATLRDRFFKVVLPLAAQGIVASAVFVLVFAWNEYIFAVIFTTRDAKTTPLIIAEILSTAEGVEWGVLFAAATVQLVPILLLVVLLQRFIIAGLTAGSVKG